jgi:NSS family neurotransmitter:Na+ symporter
MNTINTQTNLAERSQWSSLTGYILVTTGAIVGLGSIFTIPHYIAKDGGVFIICYILCQLLVSIPLLLTEVLIGRRGKQNAVGAISVLALEAGASRHWKIMGWLCFVILFLTLSYYSVEVAFPLAYLVNTASNFISHSGEASSILFDKQLAAYPPSIIIYFLLFLCATLLVVARGINRGLEKISRITVPLFFGLFLLLAIYACSVGDFKGALAYLFNFNIQQINSTVLFDALTCSFFVLNVGMGCMVVYGSYLPLTAPLGSATTAVAGISLIAALLSYFIIYPLLLLETHGVMPTTNLTYYLIPGIFSDVSGGLLLATLFFLATVIAAWTPTIALAEASTLTLIERFGISRQAAVIVIGIGAVIIGMIVVLSRQQWQGFLLFNQWSINNLIQDFPAQILTPVSALLFALFGGWIMNKKATFGELGFSGGVFTIWLFLTRYIAPIGIAVILIAALF